jgi:Tol biopolymer transport system component
LATLVSSRHHETTLQRHVRTLAAVVLMLVVAAGSTGGASSTAASPQGRIVFAHGVSGSGPPRYAVAEADLELGRCRRLLTLPRNANPPSLSVDGRSVAFLVPFGTSWELRVVTLPTGRSRTVRRGLSRPTEATWSPDGASLAYVESGGARQRRGLRVIRADGLGDRLVAPSASGGAAWSADGRELAFASTTGDGRAGTLRTTLDVILASGRGRRTLFVDPAPYGSRPSPVWSPDGSAIAFGVSERPRILLVPAAGGPARTLARGATPRWAPDGSRISFTGSGPAGVSEVWTMAPDGTEKQRLTTSLPPPRGLPQVGSYAGPWSPDGGWIAYGRKWALATVAATGGDSRARCTLPLGVGVWTAVWVD